MFPFQLAYNISIHASLAGGDSSWRSKRRSGLSFQSTPPSREATGLDPSSAEDRQFQSTPPSREATSEGRCCPHSCLISIHASLAGGDAPPVCVRSARARFQSTPPSREATAAYSRVADRWPISIHASLAGGDYLPPGEIDFLPAFQSTPPSREATRIDGG